MEELTVTALNRNLAEESAAPDQSPQSARLAGVTEALPEAVICIDRTWHMTYANAEAIRLSRLDPKLFRSMTFWDQFPTLPGTDTERRYRAAMQAGQPDQFEYFSDRLSLWIEMRTLPTDEGIALVYRDITSRKDFERREANNAKQMRQLFEAMPDSVAVIDHAWRFVFANRKAMELTGRADMVGHDIFEIFPGNKEEPFYSTYQATMEQRMENEFEAFHSAPLNLWLRVLAKPFDDGIIVFFSDISARKNAELREHSMARRLAQVLEATSDAIAALDRGWRYTYLNANAERLIDPGRRLIGKIIWDEFPLAVGSPAWDIYHRSMNDGMPGTAEIYYPEPIGRWLALFSQPTSDGIVVFFRDITEQRNHNETVGKQLEVLETVQTASKLATWACDLETGELTYGPGSYANCGVPLTSLKTFADLERIMHPGHAERMRHELKASLAANKPLLIEFAVTDPAGETIWLEARAEVSQLGGRRLVRGMSIDVTERHLSQVGLIAQQMETERRSAELESIYATTPVGMALLDPETLVFLNLNDHEARMLGAPREQILGRPLSEFAPPDKMPGLLEMMRTVAAGTPVRNQLLEGELTPLPGERRAWTVNYAPVYNEDGTIRAIATASVEITHQKRAEAALIQSEKLAAVGRLATSISHEINNPLEAMTNLLYLVALDEELPDSARVYIHTAQSELSRVSQIATQTLRFHRQAVDPTMVSAAELVDAVLRLYTGRLSNSDIRVDARYSTDARIRCFENDIRQVLNNLIANAIDAMRRGGRLKIRAHATSFPRPGVRITIADTGHGMDHATQARIFEPFFTTKDLNGTGLGLWISSGIVERHEGNLQVRSSVASVHHGTVFVLYLPIDTNPASASGSMVS